MASCITYMLLLSVLHAGSEIMHTENGKDGID